MGTGNGSRGWRAAAVALLIGAVGCTTEDGSGGAGSGSTSSGTTSAVSSTSSGSPTETCTAQCDTSEALANQLGCPKAATPQECVDGCKSYFANAGDACFAEMNAYEKCLTAHIDAAHCSCDGGSFGCVDLCTSGTSCTTQACKAEAETVVACTGMM